MKEEIRRIMQLVKDGKIDLFRNDFKWFRHRQNNSYCVALLQTVCRLAGAAVDLDVILADKTVYPAPAYVGQHLHKKMVQPLEVQPSRMVC